MARDYYLHPPGALTKSGVLDVGLKCTHSCKFCYYSYLDRSDDQFRGMRHASFRSTEDCVAILDKLHQHGFIAFDVTGGEPTLHPEIVELMRHAHQDLGMSGRIITLGQFLMRRMKSGTSDRLVDDLLKAGLTNFLLSFHSADPETFHALTGESLPKLISAMDYLDSIDFHYCTNTTVVEANYQTLPAIAREVAKHKVYIHNFIVMNAYYEWATENRAAGMQARYTAIHPYLAEAARILEGEGVGLNLRYVPLCTYPGLERHVVGVVGVRYDPYEWGNNGGHMGGTPDEAAGLIPIVEGEVEPYFGMRARSLRITDEITADAVRGANIKAFPPSCGPCDAREVCDGVDPKYLARHDASEMRPYAHIEAAGTLLEARRRYLPPFFVKRAPQTKMRDVVRPFFRPEPIPADPLVSVIVTPEDPAATDRTIAAVRGQTWTAIEVLIAADGDVNATIEAAKGDLFVCLDAGDLPEPAMLAACIDAFRDDPSLAFVYVDAGEQSAEDYDLATLRYRQIVPRTALYRRAVWQDVGGFRSHLSDAAPWDFAVAAGGRGYIGRRIAEPLIRYTGLRDGTTGGSAVDDRQAMQLVLNNADLYPRELVRKALLDQQRLDLQEAG
jgi:pyrroloquinoline quinone biosynthesis protein E